MLRCGKCHIFSSSVVLTDITDSFFDTEARNIVINSSNKAKQKLLLSVIFVFFSFSIELFDSILVYLDEFKTINLQKKFQALYQVLNPDH